MGRPIPYVPMHPPVKPVSHDRMQEILRRNTAVKVDVKPVVPEPQVETPKLEWEKPEPQSRLLHTTDRRFRVRKWSNEQAGHRPHWKYQAELLVENLWYYAFGPIRDSFAECEADCVAFLQKEAAK